MDEIIVLRVLDCYAGELKVAALYFGSFLVELNGLFVDLKLKLTFDVAFCSLRERTAIQARASATAEWGLD